jgi:hypothetical protein
MFRIKLTPDGKTFTVGKWSKLRLPRGNKNRNRVSLDMFQYDVSLVLDCLSTFFARTPPQYQGFIKDN